MAARFISWFVAAFTTSLVALGGLGYAISSVWVTTPRELYRSAAFEFELSPGWWCDRDETEDVCFPSGDKPYDAIAVMATKLRNSRDNLGAYEAHLKTPQPLDRDAKGEKTTPAMSQVKYVRRATLGGREWVEALHTNSELADFHTYYMATTTSHVGLLVTLSMRKSHEDQYIRELTRMMSSLKTYQR